MHQVMEYRKDLENQDSGNYNQGLNLPAWNEHLKVLSPNLPRNTPARTGFKLGAPQVHTCILFCTVQYDVLERKGSLSEGRDHDARAQAGNHFTVHQYFM